MVTMELFMLLKTGPISFRTAGENVYSIADQEVITYATGLGSIVVAAAHNYNNTVLIYPASYRGNLGCFRQCG